MSAFDTGLASALFGGLRAGTSARAQRLREEAFQFQQDQFSFEQQQQEAELRQAEMFLASEFDRFNPPPITEQFPTTPDGAQAVGPPIQFEDRYEPGLVAERERFGNQPLERRQREIGAMQDFELEQRIEEKLRSVREEKVMRQISQIENSDAPRQDKDRAINALVKETKELGAASRLKIFGDQAFPAGPQTLSGSQVTDIGNQFGLDPNTAALLGLQANLGGGLTQSSIAQTIKGSTAGIKQEIQVLESIADRDATAAKQAFQAWTNVVNSGSGDPVAAKREADNAAAIATASANAKIEGERRLAEALARPYNPDVLGQVAQGNDPNREPPTDLSQIISPSDGEPTLGPAIPQTAAVAPPAVSGDARVTPDGSVPGRSQASAIRLAPELSPGHTSLGLIVLDGPNGPIAVNDRQVEQAVLQAAAEFRETHGREPTAAEIETRAMEIAYGG